MLPCCVLTFQPCMINLQCPMFFLFRPCFLYKCLYIQPISVYDLIDVFYNPLMHQMLLIHHHLMSLLSFCVHMRVNHHLDLLIQLNIPDGLCRIATNDVYNICTFFGCIPTFYKLLFLTPMVGIKIWFFRLGVLGF